MKKMIQRRVNHLRNQPEHVRVRAAIISSAIAAGVLVLLWLTILLPFQLKGINSAEKSGTVAGTITPPTPIPPTNEPASTPAVTQLFQELPVSQGTDTTTPTQSPRQEPSSLPVPITQ